MIGLNCNSSKLSVIDINGVLTFYRMNSSDMTPNVVKPAEKLVFERKDVWDMKWASDNEELFAMMVYMKKFIWYYTTMDEKYDLQYMVGQCFSKVIVMVLKFMERYVWTDSEVAGICWRKRSKNISVNIQLVTKHELLERNQVEFVWNFNLHAELLLYLFLMDMIVHFRRRHECISSEAWNQKSQC